MEAETLATTAPRLEVGTVGNAELDSCRRLQTLENAGEGFGARKDHPLLRQKLGATARRGRDQGHSRDVPSRTEVLVQSEVNQPVQGVHAVWVQPGSRSGASAGPGAWRCGE